MEKINFGEERNNRTNIVVGGDNGKELMFNSVAFQGVPTYKHVIEQNFLGEDFRLPLSKECATLYKSAIENPNSEQFFNLTHIEVGYPGSDLYESFRIEFNLRNSVEDKILSKELNKKQEARRINDILFDFLYADWICNNSLICVLKGSTYDGVWIVDFPDSQKIARGGRLGLNRINYTYEDIPNLEKRLKDRNVRYVPFGFKTGYMEPEEFEESPFVFALIGEANAQALAKYCKDSPWYRKIQPFIHVYDKSKMEDLVRAYGPDASVQSDMIATLGGDLLVAKRYHLGLGWAPCFHSCDARGIKIANKEGKEK